MRRDEVMVAAFQRAAMSSRGWRRVVLGVAFAALLAWGGCNSVAGLDELVFVEEGDGGSGTGTATATATGTGAGTGTEIACGYVPLPTVSCSDTACGNCTYDDLCSFSSFEKTFENEVVACPNEVRCSLGCWEAGACTGVELVCPDTYNCSLTCATDGACTDITVICGDGPCNLECTGMTACMGVTMRCGIRNCIGDCSPAEQFDPPVFECAEQSTCSCEPC